MATNTVINVLQGNDATVNLGVLSDTGASQDCTGLTPVMTVKGYELAPDTGATQLTIGAGLAWVTQAEGTLTATLSHELLASAGSLWWRLDLLDDVGDRTTAMFGPLIITAV